MGNNSSLPGLLLLQKQDLPNVLDMPDLNPILVKFMSRPMTMIFRRLHRFQAAVVSMSRSDLDPDPDPGPDPDSGGRDAHGWVSVTRKLPSSFPVAGAAADFENQLLRVYRKLLDSCATLTEAVGSTSPQAWMISRTEEAFD